ncbi:amino acid ABC transporter ATP-binding/permease protein [Neptuniibacter sp. 2_MG-2023]|uniref:amino acid ABC transporter ATP-binding/permease protein n=1 Tax=Neptuniibacter sp. 2_MG-2023 TaxID=3062671 RepID=UPI0026E45C33|nr:ATP-binding cassette domain-containing protein [Neptuniibacter sp. 2_MG-2023]MDO6512573.1 ATP-binding cassette domain-containing protein [Neptuniibacter sp. 2_MG-2023]
MNNVKRHYLKLLRQEYKMALLGVLLAVITAYSGIALLAVSGWFISAAALAGLSAVAAHSFNFFAPGAIVRGLSMSRTAGRYGERLSSHEATFRIISNLRADLFRLISRLNWNEQQLNRHETSSRLLQDIQNIEAIYLSAILPAAVSFLVMVAYLVTLYLVLPALIPWVIIPLIFATFVMPWLYSHRVLQSESTLHKRHSEQWLSASALLSNMRTLTLFKRLKHSGEYLQKQAQESDNYESMAVQRQQQILLLTQAILIIMTVLIFWQGLLAFQQGQLEGAYAFMLLLLTLGSAEVLLNNCPALANLGLGLAALDRLQDNLTNNTETLDKRTFTQTDSSTIGLHINQLNYRYPQQKADIFKQFNLRYDGPNWIWLNGSSGVGKSTLLSLIYGQLAPSAGSIEFTGLNADEIRFMPQRIDILRATLRDNLTLNITASEQAIRHALNIVELGEWAKRLPNGLDTWLGEGEWQPSGGERKRIGLARLILQNPQLILLDEPTAGMDSTLAAQIYSQLRAHWADKIVLCSSHEHDFITTRDKRLELTALKKTVS